MPSEPVEKLDPAPLGPLQEESDLLHDEENDAPMDQLDPSLLTQEMGEEGEADLNERPDGDFMFNPENIYPTEPVEGEEEEERSLAAAEDDAFDAEIEEAISGLRGEAQEKADQEKIEKVESLSQDDR